MIVRAKEDVNDMVRSESANYALGPNRLYLVIEIYDNDYRVVPIGGVSVPYDGNQFPALYDRDEFDVLDAYIPETWLQYFQDGVFCAHPPEFSGYFFDDLSEYIPAAIATYELHISRILNEIILRSRSGLQPTDAGVQ